MHAWQLLYKSGPKWLPHIITITTVLINTGNHPWSSALFLVCFRKFGTIFFVFRIWSYLFIYLGFLRRIQDCTGHITTGSWKGRGNQYTQLVKVLYCKLPTNGKHLPAFPLEVEPWTEPPASEVSCYRNATTSSFWLGPACIIISERCLSSSSYKQRQTNIFQNITPWRRRYEEKVKIFDSKAFPSLSSSCGNPRWYWRKCNPLRVDFQQFRVAIARCLWNHFEWFFLTILMALKLFVLFSKNDVWTVFFQKRYTCKKYLP